MASNKRPSKSVEKLVAVVVLALYVILSHDLSAWLNSSLLNYQQNDIAVIKTVHRNSSSAIILSASCDNLPSGHFGWVCWIFTAYCLWHIYDRDTCKKGGRPIQSIRRWSKLRRIAAEYPVTLEKTCELDPQGKYIIGYHPHGVSGSGAVFNFATEATGLAKTFPGIDFHLLTHSTLHQFPVFRELISVFGMADVSRESINYLLQEKGRAVVVIVGGAKETLMSVPDKTYLVLKNRKGFVRMALQNGAHLVPSFTFGETQIWKLRSHVFPWTKLSLFQKAYIGIYAYPPVLVMGQGFFNTPFRVPVHTIVGKPITVEKDPSPSEEKVDDIHRRYMQALIDLYEDNKSRFGLPPDNKLIFID